MCLASTNSNQSVRVSSCAQMWEEEAFWKVGESVEEHLICFKDEATIGGKRKQIVHREKHVETTTSGSGQSQSLAPLGTRKERVQISPKNAKKVKIFPGIAFAKR